MLFYRSKTWVTTNQWCKSYFLKVTRYSYKLPAEKSNALQLLFTDT